MLLNKDTSDIHNWISDVTKYPISISSKAENASITWASTIRLVDVVALEH